MLASAVVLVMTLCVSAFAGLKSGSWSLNPADFRYDMSLYFSLADRSLEDLDTYEIGAFVDDECRGVAEKLELTGGETCLYMRIRSNSAQGAQIEFRMRQKGSDEYVVLRPEDGADFIFKSNDRVGMPSAPFVLARYFNIEVTSEGNGTIDFENGLYKEGAQISVKAIADEGYRFSEWSDGLTEADRVITVSGDLSLSASFVRDIYKVVFKIDGEEFKTLDVAFGALIQAPEAPVRLGYVFDGWGEIPPTMPAEDLEFNGTYSPAIYKAVFKVDGEEIASYELAYDAPLVAPDVEEKEGYTFNGWGELP
ncbi:MAG: InlB B-repeat-containing protein, partial [Bacteroides sp.]|nr:InlB B-repeat-containing protein [Bacteroides sp.]